MISRTELIIWIDSGVCNLLLISKRMVREVVLID